nr:hypothetical protein CFP56_21848 [Quercus suber]
MICFGTDTRRNDLRGSIRSSLMAHIAEHGARGLSFADSDDEILLRCRGAGHRVGGWWEISRFRARRGVTYPRGQPRIEHGQEMVREAIVTKVINVEQVQSDYRPAFREKYRSLARLMKVGGGLGWNGTKLEHLR